MLFAPAGQCNSFALLATLESPAASPQAAWMPRALVGRAGGARGLHGFESKWRPRAKPAGASWIRAGHPQSLGRLRLEALRPARVSQS